MLTNSIPKIIFSLVLGMGTNVWGQTIERVVFQRTNRTAKVTVPSNTTLQSPWTIAREEFSPLNGFFIEAVADATTESVRFLTERLNNGQFQQDRNRTENQATYDIEGGGNIANGWRVAVNREYRITMTPFDQDNAQGNAGTPIVIFLKVVDTVPRNPGAYSAPDMVSHVDAETVLKAKKLWSKVVGVSPAANDPAFAQVIKSLQDGDLKGAADTAVAQPGFINNTVWEMASQLCDFIEHKIVSDLNACIALVAGIIRDNKPYTEVLTADYNYLPRPSFAGAAGSTVTPDLSPQAVNTTEGPWLSISENFADPSAAIGGTAPQMIPEAGDVATEITHPEPAGAVTTITGARHLFSAGTGRRIVEKLFESFLCSPYDNLRSSSTPDVFVRQDVDRAPNNDPSLFRNDCVTCHASLDGMARSIVHWDLFESSPTSWIVQYIPNHNQYTSNMNNKTAARVYARQGSDIALKTIHNNNVFPGGHEATSNKWENLLASNPSIQARMGFEGDTNGEGLRDLAVSLSKSKMFNKCSATTAFKAIVKRAPNESEDAVIEELAKIFKASGYNFKTLAAYVATLPSVLGE